MSHSLTYTEIRQLLAKWSNGTLEREEEAKLNFAIETDSKARKLYLEYVSVESELLAVHTGSSLNKMHQILEEHLELDESADLAFLQQLDSHLGGAQLSGVKLSGVKHRRVGSLIAKEAARDISARVGSAVRSAKHRFARNYSAWVLAASLATIATLFGLFQLMSNGPDAVAHAPLDRQQQLDSPQQIATHPRNPHSNQASLPSSTATFSKHPEKAGTNQPVLARITASRNCRWANPSLAIGYGAELVAGQKLHLDAGLAEITFADGTQVILEGPAKLNLAADTESVLLSGRLAATMPAGVEVIPVRTSRMRVAGSRTPESLNQERASLHIGLSADSASGEQVHVFQGKVQAFLMGDRSEDHSPGVALVSREAAQIKPASTTVAKIFANRDMFIQSISSTGGPQDGLYAYEGFDYPEGPLSGQNGGFGWAGAWADIEAACPPGQLATNVALEGNLNYRKMRAIGGHAAQIKQQNRIRRALSTSLGGVFDSASLVENQDGQRLVGANGKTIYLSFLQQVDRTDDGFYGVELHRGDGNSNRVFCLGNGAEGAGYGVTSNFNAYGKLNYQRLDEETTDVNFVVVKIEFGPFNSDQVTVYRNPESLIAEELAARDAVLQGNFAFDRISFGNFDGTKVHGVDEIRIGTTYRAVTGLRDRGDERLTPSFALNRQKNNTGELRSRDILSLLAKRPTLSLIQLVPTQ